LRGLDDARWRSLLDQRGVHLARSRRRSLALAARPASAYLARSRRRSLALAARPASAYLARSRRRSLALAARPTTSRSLLDQLPSRSRLNQRMLQSQPYLARSRRRSLALAARPTTNRSLPTTYSLADSDGLGSSEGARPLASAMSRACWILSLASSTLSW